MRGGKLLEYGGLPPLRISWYGVTLYCVHGVLIRYAVLGQCVRLCCKELGPSDKQLELPWPYLGTYLGIYLVLGIHVGMLLLTLEVGMQCVAVRDKEKQHWKCQYCHCRMQYTTWGTYPR